MTSKKLFMAMTAAVGLESFAANATTAKANRKTPSGDASSSEFMSLLMVEAPPVYGHPRELF
jgi:hypothetical protein